MANPLVSVPTADFEFTEYAKVSIANTEQIFAEDSETALAVAAVQDAVARRSSYELKLQPSTYSHSTAPPTPAKVLFQRNVMNAIA